MARDVPAVLVLLGVLSCTVLGKYLVHQKQLLMRPNFDAKTTVCRATPGLSRPHQMDLCLRRPDETMAALEGLQLAVKECQHQLQHHRWNCSSLATRAKNPYMSAIFQRGFRETAFAYAISTAGVVLSVAKACSEGSLSKCGCDTRKYKMKTVKDQNSVWKMGGCSHNLHYGMKFSKKFLDSKESGADMHSAVNLHNNRIGRRVVAENMQMKCKCHGLSGGCELKTCFRVVPDIRVVGRALKEKFSEAVLVHQSNLANREPQVNRPNQKKQNQRTRLKLWTSHKQKRKHGLRNELLFYENQPNFCESDETLDVVGTSGRYCNRTHTGEGSCESLCCGRGYNRVKQRRTQTCNCRFHWCCKVECENCTVEEWITTCK